MKIFVKLQLSDTFRPKNLYTLGRIYAENSQIEDATDIFEQVLREQKEIEPRQYPFRMIRKDGTVVWVDMRSSHASYMGIPAAVGNFIDISKERKAQEEKQMLSRKLIEGIEDFGSRFKDLKIDFQSIGFKRRLPPEVEIVIYRIFQEGLNNVTKHSNATIKLTASHPEVIFIIQDNGDGFEQMENEMPKKETSLGIGLLSMKERVASLNGSINIKSIVKKGTVIRVGLPMASRRVL